MATKKERVYIRVTETQKEKLQKMAKQDSRSLSNYILTVVESHINKEDNSVKIRVKKENENMKKYKVEITRNGKAWTEEIQAENGDSACYKALEPYAKKMGGKVVHGIQGIGVESPVVGSWPTQYKISYWATCLT